MHQLPGPTFACMICPAKWFLHFWDPMLCFNQIVVWTWNALQNQVTWNCVQALRGPSTLKHVIFFLIQFGWRISWIQIVDGTVSTVVRKPGKLSLMHLHPCWHARFLCCAVPSAQSLSHGVHMPNLQTNCCLCVNYLLRFSPFLVFWSTKTLSLACWFVSHGATLCTP